MSLEELRAERERVLKEIRQLENRQKILLNKEGNIERRARTRRLIEHGAILERYGWRRSQSIFAVVF